MAYTENKPVGLDKLVQCVEVSKDIQRKMSRIDIEKRICSYENYSKFVERMSTIKPVNSNRVYFNNNDSKLHTDIKEKMIDTNEKCTVVVSELRELLKKNYNVEKFSCK